MIHTKPNINFIIHETNIWFCTFRHKKEKQQNIRYYTFKGKRLIYPYNCIKKDL